MKSFLFCFLFCLLFSACNNPNQVKKRNSAERQKAEQQKRNNLQKGYYRCWRITSNDSEIAAPFYILSDDMYQLDDATGMYHFDNAANSISFLSGPLYQPEKWVGSYHRNISTLDQNAIPKEIMIILQQTLRDTSHHNALHCKCDQFQY